jgi:hypothetical protein
MVPVGPRELMGRMAIEVEGGSTAPENVPQQRQDAQMWIQLSSDQRVNGEKALIRAFELMGSDQPEGYLRQPQPMVPAEQIQGFLSQLGVPPELFAQFLEAQAARSSSRRSRRTASQRGPPERAAGAGDERSAECLTSRSPTSRGRPVRPSTAYPRRSELSCRTGRRRASRRSQRHRRAGAHAGRHRRRLRRVLGVRAADARSARLPVRRLQRRRPGADADRRPARRAGSSPGATGPQGRCGRCLGATGPAGPAGGVLNSAYFTLASVAGHLAYNFAALKPTVATTHGDAAAFSVDAGNRVLVRDPGVYEIAFAVFTPNAGAEIRGQFNFAAADPP